MINLVILNTMKPPGNKKIIDIKDLISQLPISEYSKTNPIIPPMEYILEGKKFFTLIVENSMNFREFYLTKSMKQSNILIKLLESKIPKETLLYMMQHLVI